MRMLRKRKVKQTAALGLCLCMAFSGQAEAENMAVYLKNSGIKGLATGSDAWSGGLETASGSDAWTEYPATASNSLLRSAATGDLWKDWIGDLSFLNGRTGDGSQEKPYQISTAAHLMGLSELTAMGMVIPEGEGTTPGDYRGAWFELSKNIDLGGINWMPIGFYRDMASMEAGLAEPFVGHFNGNGKEISNFRFYHPEWTGTGLFGVVEDSTIEDLIVKPLAVLTSRAEAGILAGSAARSQIRNVTVTGAIKASGTAGGVVGEVSEDTILENCFADHISVDGGEAKETFTGGITGKAAGSLIVDCAVSTGDTLTSRIRGSGHVGGVTGFQNGTDIFNVHVMGTVGGAGAQSIGGVTGKYASGKLKVARFEGTIAGSGMGSAAREGTFIGTHDTGFHFRYGLEEGADLAYLFANSEQKIAAGICGSGIPDDNKYTYDAHIGFWHSGDNHFTLVQGRGTAPQADRYFYEELEQGILHVIDKEDGALEGDYSPDHFAPNGLGRPVRGYLVSVLQIDTAANVQNYYDVAELTVRGESAYSHDLDKEKRGAVAAGDVVTVVTAPKNTTDAKYQMEGVPTYTDKNGKLQKTSYETGGTYRFVMPACDTEVSAVYKKVAADVRILPEEFCFRVVEERSGDRKNPSRITEVRDENGKLLARYLNGTPDYSVKVQDVQFEAVVDKNNDVEDHSVLWSVDDADLIHVKKNDDEDSGGYTKKSASVELNLKSDFFTKILDAAEKEQKVKNYQYPMSDRIYGDGNQGGIAVLTAKTKPAASFEGKPLSSNCKIRVTFQIKDKTRVAAEGASLSQNALKFTVTRTLTGNRKNPQETLTVTAPQPLSAQFHPDFFDRKDVSWTVDDGSVLEITPTADGRDYKNVLISARKDSGWIQNLMAADDQVYKEKPEEKRSGTGEKRVKVTVAADDTLGNKQTAVCDVTVEFLTDDRTTVWGSSSGSGNSGGSSGSSGSSGAKGGSSGITTFGTTNSKSSAPAGSVTGTWVQDGDGYWMFTGNGRTYAAEWAYIHNPYAAEGQPIASWFRFGADGRMITGWFQDEKQSWYFLHRESDGSQGHMVTGWCMIDGVWYFFGEDGRMYSDRQTPDGYFVDSTGAWIP